MSNELGLDLNINDYDIIELEKILNITRPYKFEIIKINANKLKSKIISLSLQKRKQTELENFIKDAVAILERNYIFKRVKRLERKIQKLTDLLQKKIV